jgi:quinoprotein glucose dehydrogenase
MGGGCLLVLCGSPFHVAAGLPMGAAGVMLARSRPLSDTLDRFVRADDATTGHETWKDRLPAGGQARPMTREGAGGRQHARVTAGGHGSVETEAGESVIAHALPR